MSIPSVDQIMHMMEQRHITKTAGLRDACERDDVGAARAAVQALIQELGSNGALQSVAASYYGFVLELGKNVATEWVRQWLESKTGIEWGADVNGGLEERR